jgi:hypothetical protein
VPEKRAIAFASNFIDIAIEEKALTRHNATVTPVPRGRAQ